MVPLGTIPIIPYYTPPPPLPLKQTRSSGHDISLLLITVSTCSSCLYPTLYEKCKERLELACVLDLSLNFGSRLGNWTFQILDFSINVKTEILDILVAVSIVRQGS